MNLRPHQGLPPSIVPASHPPRPSLSHYLSPSFSSLAGWVHEAWKKLYQSNSQCCEKDKRHKECLPDLQVSSLDLPYFNYWMMSKAETVWACQGIPCISEVPPSTHSARRRRSPPCKKSGTKGCAQETSLHSGLWEKNNA